MSASGEQRGGLRCRPGDLARVVYSANPLLIGRTVFIEGWGGHGRWNVTLLGAPSFGLEFETKRPVVGNKTAFRDSSLAPIGDLDGREESVGGISAVAC